VVYYEQDGDELCPMKPTGGIVTTPDYEILQVRKNLLNGFNFC